MKCSNCQAEIKDDAAFCPFCGARQQAAEPPKEEQPKKEQQFCPACGSPMKSGARFCPSCGHGMQGVAHTPSGTEQPLPEGGAQAQQPKGKGHIVALVFLAIALLLCIGIGLAIRHALVGTPSPFADRGIPPAASDFVPDDVPIEVPKEKEKVSADLVADGVCDLIGKVSTSADGSPFLKWDIPISILMDDEKGERVLLEAVSSAYLANNGVEEGIWAQIPEEEYVVVRSTLSLKGSKLYLMAEEVLDRDGNALTLEPDEAETYILPDSDKRLLTDADVADLSLQEINYAKNEIFARHGRRFLSSELQTYFDGKTWYHGTVSASDFSESSLSEIERKNADFLAKVEFGIAPNGYKLDA